MTRSQLLLTSYLLFLLTVWSHLPPKPPPLPPAPQADAIDADLDHDAEERWWVETFPPEP